MWMRMVQAGIDGEVARWVWCVLEELPSCSYVTWLCCSRDVEAQLNHVLVKPEPAIYFLAGNSDLLSDSYDNSLNFSSNFPPSYFTQVVLSAERSS